MAGHVSTAVRVSAVVPLEAYFVRLGNPVFHGRVYVLRSGQTELVHMVRSGIGRYPCEVRVVDLFGQYQVTVEPPLAGNHDCETHSGMECNPCPLGENLDWPQSLHDGRKTFEGRADLITGSLEVGFD